MSNSVGLRNALIQSVLDASISLPTAWPNAPFDTPNGSPWVRITPMNATPTPVSFSGTDQIDGILQIDVFDVENSGDMLGYEICDQVRQAFPLDGSATTSGGISVRFKSVAVKGQGEDGVWYKTMIEAHYYSYLNRND